MNARMQSTPTLLFYCQHSLGMGHLMRALALVRALTSSFRVVLLNGGAFPKGIAVPADLQWIDLPPVAMGPERSLVSLDPLYGLERAMDVRRSMIVQAFASTRPSVVLIELFPFGRKKFAGEIVPLLDAASARGDRPLVLCSLRDILVGGRPDQQRHDDRAASLVNRYFDGVLVHSDPAFARLEESFQPTTPLTVPVYYTGFVHAASGATLARSNGDVLVSAGSGSVGERLFDTAIAAHEVLWAKRRLPMRIVTGPLAPATTCAAVASASRRLPGLTAIPSVADLAAEMRRALVSVSQCGYNSAMDLIAAQVPAVVVPYSTGREDEQHRRALRLGELGVVSVLPDRFATGCSLALAIERALNSTPAPVRLDLQGASTTAAILHDRLNVRPAPGNAHLQRTVSLQ